MTARARHLRAYRLVRIGRWSFLAVFAVLFAVQAVLDPVRAVAAQPVDAPALIAPAADSGVQPTEANGMKFEGFGKYKGKCVVVPQNIDGSFWRYYCLTKDNEPRRVKIVILDEKGDGTRAIGPYLGPASTQPWPFWGDFNDDAPKEYKKLVDAQEAWAGTTSAVIIQYRTEQRDDLIKKGTRSVAPVRPKGMSDAEWYGQKSFTAAGSGGKKPSNPCGFFNQAGGKDTQFTCRDPRVQTPCPEAELTPELLKLCTSDSKVFYDEFSKAWAAENKDPCATSKGGVSGCEDNTPGKDPDEAVVSEDDYTGLKDIKFMDDPIAWTKQELSKASIEVMPWWIHADDPEIVTGDDYQTQQTVDFITRHTNIITFTIVVLSVVIAGSRMVIQRNGEPAKEVAQSLVTLVVVSALGVTVVNYLVRAGAVFSDWFIVAGLNPESHGKLGGQSPDAAVELAIRQFANSAGSLNFFVFLVAALFMIVGSIVQYFYMVVRFFLVIILTGTLSLAAAGTNTAAGKDWFKKHILYLAAFILVKPAAVIVFVSGARLWAPRGGDDDDDGVMDLQMGMDVQFRGLFVILLITLLLPAMLRIIVPIVSPAAGSEGAGIALATGAITGLAKGAAMVGSAGAAIGAKGAGMAAGAATKAHKGRQFNTGRAWSDDAKQDWSGNWNSNVRQNWDNNWQANYQQQAATFNGRFQARMAAGQTWDDAYQSTHRETHQAASAATWQQTYQDTYTQTWQQDEQRRNPGAPIGPAPAAPAQQAPVFSAPPTTPTPAMGAPAAVTAPPPPAGAAPPPPAPNMPDNP